MAQRYNVIVRINNGVATSFGIMLSRSYENLFIGLTNVERQAMPRNLLRMFSGHPSMVTYDSWNSVTNFVERAKGRIESIMTIDVDNPDILPYEGLVYVDSETKSLPALSDIHSLQAAMRSTMSEMVDQIRSLESGISKLASDTARLARETETCGEPEWIVTDEGELGVRINGINYTLYKGESLKSERPWRKVMKREFGEVCHAPILKVLATENNRPYSVPTYIDKQRWSKRFDWNDPKS